MLSENALRLPVPGRRFLLELTALVLGTVGVVFLTYVASSPTFGVRLAITTLFLWLFMALAMIRPAGAVFACVLWAPWIGVTRRMLDAAQGGVGVDPLLAIVPMVLSVALLATLVVHRLTLLTLWRQSLLFRLVALLTALLALEALNPLQGGLAVSLGGSIYRLIPLFPAIIVAAAGTRRFGGRLLRLVVITGVLDAAYGLNQTWHGLPGYDQLWVDQALLNGYNSLSVGGTIRAFGTFASAAEYVYYLDIAAAVALTFAVVAWRQRRRSRALASLLAFGLCSLAVVLGSSRASLILLLLVVAFLFMVHQRTLVRGLLVTVVVAGIAFLVQQHLPTTISGSGGTSQLLTHEFGTVSGGNLLNDTSIRGHIASVLGGILAGILQPFGHGLGAATLAAGKLGGSQLTTELDVTDMFVAAGFLGGVLYLAVLAGLVMTAVRLYRCHGRAEHLAAGAALVAAFGEVLGQGYYALGPTLLALSGWLILEEVRLASHPDSPRRIGWGRSAAR